MIKRLLLVSLVVVATMFAQQPTTSPTESARKTTKKTPQLPPHYWEDQRKHMEELFPNAPDRAKDAECFRSLPKQVSMYQVVERCGRPNAEVGSGFMIFEYQFKDGSYILANCGSSPEKVYSLRFIDRRGKHEDIIDNWPSAEQKKSK